ncbi:MAG: hypothetical protein DMG26_02530 [Acidobacteria bacterium]|nr:MAG: hypothetical protein DMG26_02530 [Acidobacteriota bacterium]
MAEEALGASEGRCQILFDVVPQPMLAYRLDTLRFIAVNDAAVRHYGYSRREFLAMTINDLCLPDDDLGPVRNLPASILPALPGSEPRGGTGTKTGRPSMWRFPACRWFSTGGWPV